MTFFTAFLIGLFVGGAAGAMAMALCRVAARSDKEML